MIYDDDLPIQDWRFSSAQSTSHYQRVPRPRQNVGDGLDGGWSRKMKDPSGEPNQELKVSQPKIMAFTAKFMVILWYFMVMLIVKIWLKMMVNQFINHHHICPNMVDYDGFTSVKRTCQWITLWSWGHRDMKRCVFGWEIVLVSSLGAKQRNVSKVQKGGNPVPPKP